MTRADIERIISTSSAMRGCTCTPRIHVDMTDTGQVLAATVDHADDCRATPVTQNWN